MPPGGTRWLPDDSAYRLAMRVMHNLSAYAGQGGGGAGQPGGGGLGTPVGEGGGLAPTCPVVGDSSRLPAGGGGHAGQQRVKGMASTLVHSALGGGTFYIHVHASTGWKDWTSTPVHISTGWRVRWMLRHCSQPPPRYQSRGYGSAAVAAPGPQRTHRCCCTRCNAAALALLLHCSQPPPRYHRGAMGLLLQPHSSCSAHTVAAAARVCIPTAAKPAPLPIKGPRGCCTSRTLAAAHAMQRRRRCHAAPVVLQLHRCPPLPCYQPRGRGG